MIRCLKSRVVNLFDCGDYYMRAEVAGVDLCDVGVTFDAPDRRESGLHGSRFKAASACKQCRQGLHFVFTSYPHCGAARSAEEIDRDAYNVSINTATDSRDFLSAACPT